MAPVQSPALDSAVSYTGQWVSTVATFALAVVALVYVVRVARAERAWWPFLVLASGTLTCLMEPMFDHLYGLWFPTRGQWTLFTAYGVSEPVWLVPAYFSIYGGGALLILRAMQKRPTAATVWRMYAVMVAVAMVAEISYVQLMGVYEYQDDQPWVVLGYPLFLGFVNSMSALIGGVLLWKLIPLVRGPWRLGLVLVTPVAFAMEAFGGGVIYLALRHGSENPSSVLLHVAALTVPLGTICTAKLLTLLVPADPPPRTRTELGPQPARQRELVAG